MVVKKNETIDNCLSLIKLLAAFQVMYGHLKQHLNLPGVSESINKMIWYFKGVPVFFVVSGFLIWLSIERTRSYREFLRKRLFRIYPELWAAVIIEITSIVILYSGWNAKELILFTFTQGTIFQFWTPDSLRSYGCGTPNGTLWTICVMIQFYFISWLIHKLMHKKAGKIWIVSFVCITFVSNAGQYCFDVLGFDILNKLYGQTIVKYLWLFYIGCFIAEFREKLLSFLKKYWFVLVLVGGVVYFFDFDIYAGYNVFTSVLLTSGLIGFAYRFPQLSLSPDISYGLFLYHMILVNACISFGFVENWLYALVVILLTVAFAYISTVTIGRWSSKRRKVV